MNSLIRLASIDEGGGRWYSLQLNKTTDYAIRMIIFLSQQDEITTSEKISQATGVTKNYVMKIARKLTKFGLIKRERGIKGGYLLNKPTNKISIYDIIVIMEPTIKINQCLEDTEECDLKGTSYCPVRNFYSKLQNDMENRFKNMTIDKLIKDL